LDTFLFIRAGAGFEAFASRETLAAARKLMGEAMSVLYMMQFPELCRSQRWPWQWLGISIDQCSVGVCGCNFLRDGLKLLVEPLYDGIHGVHRDVFRAMDLARLWPLMMVMKIMYTFSYGPWLGAKWLSESREVVRDAYAHAKAQIRQLWDFLLSGIARDIGDSSLQFDEARSTVMFEEMPDSPILRDKGPKMTINGWMQYKRATRHWDPYFHRRLFVLLIHAMKKGLLTGTVAALNLKVAKVTKVSTTEGPNTKKGKEATMASLKGIGRNQVHSVCIIYCQGWRLQRDIRLVEETTEMTDQFYNKVHHACRSETKTLEHYLYMSGQPPLFQSIAKASKYQPMTTNK
jgi:hypothetical protein